MREPRLTLGLADCGARPWPPSSSVACPVLSPIRAIASACARNALSPHFCCPKSYVIQGPWLQATPVPEAFPDLVGFLSALEPLALCPPPTASSPICLLPEGAPYRALLHSHQAEGIITLPGASRGLNAGEARGVLGSALGMQ